MAAITQPDIFRHDDFNLTDDLSKLGHTVPTLFCLAARRYPGHPAVICGNSEITYAKLDSDSDRIAQILQSRSIGVGHIVGVAVGRSIDLIVLLLGVLKAGAAYIPIDPALPDGRVSQMLDDEALRLVITDNVRKGEYTCGHGATCCTLDELDEMTTASDDSTKREVRPNDLAYIIYTSGSTGRPKGVQVHHEALCNYSLTVQARPGCTHADRVLATSTVSFDIAVLELYSTLLSGATVILAQSHEIKDARALQGLIERHQVTTACVTPTMWQMLLGVGWTGTASLTRLLSGGEALTSRLASKLLSCADEVWNMYGPTETTVSVSTWRVEAGKEVLIGTPNHNTKLYVLDETLRHASVGTTGELYISGAGVSQGYRNNRALTEAAFIPDPFVKGCTMYRTGDLACFIGPGELRVLGRADSQVKIRGHRLEPGDIEAAITTHNDIVDAVVVVRDDRLVAYCVRKPQLSETHAVADSNGQVANFLRPWLEERLPAYMVPSFFVEIPQLPMTINGKVDTRALPDPIFNIAPGSVPKLEVAQKLKSIWSRILGHSHIGMDDNFFHTGGDSARAIQMQVEVERFLGRPVLTAKLYEHYTIRALAAYLSGSGEQELKSNEASPKPLPNTRNEDIAVISMACRLPGNINTPDDFWRVLVDGQDVITEVPKDRWDADAIYDADPDASGKSYSTGGGFVESATSFDAAFFGISPREARSVDPAQSMILETCWEGFERAGYGTKGLSGSQTGVFIGAGNSLLDDGHLSSHGMENLAGHVGLGTAPSALSGRISYALGLEGPSITVDSGCAASLVATHLACTALRQGECDMAVAGGVTFLPSPGLHIEFSRLRVASPDGRSRPFSADANGMGLAEGASAIVLKRLSDAQRDGDDIHVVIRGSSVKHGGRGPSLTAPSGKGQKQMLRAAVSAAGLAPHDIDYIEAHGTGTKQGDPIEGTAIAEVFGSSRSPVSGPLRLGSSKSNIGHTQAAAGVVGLIKVALAMRHGMLPQTLHSAKLNPLIDWKASNMKICQTPSPWLPRDVATPRRAGINSFGIAGTGAHVVVEEPPNKRQTAFGPEGTSEKPMPFLISALSQSALLQQAKSLSSFVDREDVHLPDVAFSLATTRKHFPLRRVVVSRNREELKNKLDNSSKDFAPSVGGNTMPAIGMLFSGQGSQWVGMGRQLAKDHDVFRTHVHEIANLFRSFLEHPLLDVMWAEPGGDLAALLQRTDYAQPALFTLQVALWQLWKSWGIQPEAVLGHSIGELAAAHVAGVMNLADACRLVAERGRLMHALPATGGMLAVEATVDEATDALDKLFLEERLCIAGINTPTQIILSGDKDDLEHLAGHFRYRKRTVKFLPTSGAFHSHHLNDEMLASLRKVAASIAFNPQTIPIVSTVTGRVAEAGELGCPEYWIEQARQPVQFVNGMHSLAQQGIEAFVELGPGSVLCGMGAACIDDAPATGRSANMSWLPSLSAKSLDSSTMLNSLCELHIRQSEVDWAGYFRDVDCRRIELPTYAFQRQQHWLSGLSPQAASKSSSSSSSPSYSSVKSRSADSLSSLVSLDDSSSIESLDSGKEVGGRVQNRIQIGWHAIDVGREARNSTWGLMCPTSDILWVAQVKEALSHSGRKAITVTSLNEADEMGGIICLWDAKDEQGSKTDVTLAVSQLHAAADSGFPSPLVWITRGAVGAGSVDGGGIDETSLWGKMRSARIKYPQLQLRIVDLGDEVDLAAASTLVSIIMLRNEPECIVRGGRILVPWMQLERMPPCVSLAPRTTGIPTRHQRMQKRDLQVNVSQQRDEQGKGYEASSSTADSWVERLRNAQGPKRGVLLQTLVKEATAQALGMSSPDEVDMYRSLEDAGLDSLGATQLRKLLAAQIEVMLPVNFKTAHNNLKAVCEALERQLEQMWSEEGTAA